MEAQAILEEAATLADEQNGSVIAAAFRSASVCCPDCRFPQNVVEFRSLLFDYTELRKELHRSRKSDWCSFSRWGTHYRRYTDTFAIETRAKKVRRELTLIWPCQGCIERFNPTGKINYPAFSQPKPKGFLE